MNWQGEVVGSWFLNARRRELPVTHYPYIFHPLALRLQPLPFNFQYIDGITVVLYHKLVRNLKVGSRN